MSMVATKQLNVFNMGLRVFCKNMFTQCIRSNELFTYVKRSTRKQPDLV